MINTQAVMRAELYGWCGISRSRSRGLAVISLCFDGVGEVCVRLPEQHPLLRELFVMRYDNQWFVEERLQHFMRYSGARCR